MTLHTSHLGYVKSTRWNRQGNQRFHIALHQLHKLHTLRCVCEAVKAV